MTQFATLKSFVMVTKYDDYKKSTVNKYVLVIKYKIVPIPLHFRRIKWHIQCFRRLQKL